MASLSLSSLLSLSRQFVRLFCLFSLFLSLLCLVSSSASSAFAQGGSQGNGGGNTIPPAGDVPETAISVPANPGSTFPWEGEAGNDGDLNTGNGNKLTSIPLVGWTARGGMPVSLALHHNSQAVGSSELGPKWLHSFDIYGVVNPSTGDFSVRWGDGLGYPFTYDAYTDTFDAPTGIYDDLDYTVDSNANVIRYTLTTKGGVVYVFENPTGNRWNCISITDRNGNQITIAHDALDFVTGVTDPTGRSLTFTYDSNHKLVSVTDPLSRVFTFVYNGSGQLTSVVYPSPTGQGNGDNPIVSFGYDFGNHITSLTDPRGKVWTFSYSGNGSLLWEKDPLNNQTTYSYTVGYTDITDANNHTTRHNYTNGRLSSVVDAQTYSASFGYDSSNNRTSVTDQAGETSALTYDSRGNVLTVTDPLNHTTTTTYNGLDLPLTVTTHLGRTVTYTYSTSGNPLTMTNPASQTTTLTYDSYGQVLTATDALSHVSTFTYDSHGNVASVTDATGKVTTFVYDLLGRKTSQTVPGGYSSTVAYDGLGRVTSVTAPGSRVTSFTYDAAGNKLSQTNALGKTDTFVYDDAGRVTSHTDALSRTMSFGYDASGNKTSFTDGRGNVTYYGYNARDLMTSLTYPDSTSESWTYTARGQVASHTDGRGIVTTSTYDDAGRLTGVSYSGGSAASVSVVYDADNRKTGQTDGTGTTSYGYDTVGRLTSRTSPQGNVSYAYDAAGRKTGQMVGSATTTYSYDNAGRLLSAVAPNGTTTYAYDAAGRVSGVTLPNGTTQSYAYDAVTGDLLQLWHKNSGGGTLVQYSYGYDNLGRKTSEVQWGGNFNGAMVAYAYDDAGQLTAETRSGTNLYTASYSYDNAGNRLTKTVGGVTEAYSYDAANKLLSVTGASAKTYGYDNAGNVTSVTSSAGTTNLTWDGAGRLTSASNGTLSNAFSYNGLGQRTGKTDSHGTFSYVLADDSIDSPVLADGQATYQYAMGLVSEVRGGASKVIHADSLGTTRTLTDSSQSVTDSLETDAFGNVVTTAGAGALGSRPFGFAGQHGYQTDTDTGLMRLGHRYYDSSTGRFISRDPILDGYNWYVYCGNDPVNGIDPAGLETVLVVRTTGYFWGTDNAYKNNPDGADHISKPSDPKRIDKDGNGHAHLGDGSFNNPGTVSVYPGGPIKIGSRIYIGGLGWFIAEDYTAKEKPNGDPMPKNTVDIWIGVGTKEQADILNGTPTAVVFAPGEKIPPSMGNLRLVEAPPGKPWTDIYNENKGRTKDRGGYL